MYVYTHINVCISTKRKNKFLDILERFYNYCNGKPFAETVERLNL